MNTESWSLSVNLFNLQYKQELCIKNPIGRGAGSFVCKIEHRQTHKEYACKIVQKNSNPKQIARLQNEVNLHSSLEHQYIVDLIKHLEDQDNHYLIMELCEHELYQFIKSKPEQKYKSIKNKILFYRFSEQETKYYGYQLVQGLHYLHQKHIIHRDLKLGNLLLKDKILVQLFLIHFQKKIADFGLAVQLNDCEEERNTLCGTPNYISPEILNHQPYGKKVDLWSLGCCLYSMINGKGPFECPSTSLGDVLKKVQIGNFELPNSISPAFQDLLRNLISLDASSRYSSEEILTHPFFITNVPQQMETPITPMQPRLQKTQSSVMFNARSAFSPQFIKFNDVPIAPLKSRQPSTHNDEGSTFGNVQPGQVKQNLQQLVNFSPFTNPRSHRPTNSFISMSNQTNKVVNQFLQQQQTVGGKKMLFGLTTVGKCTSNRDMNLQSGSLPKFSLQNAGNVVQGEDVKNQWLAKQMIKKLGLDEDKENSPNLCNISPLRLNDIKPCKLKTKNGLIEVNEGSNFQMEIINSNIVFSIFENGTQVGVKKENQKIKTYKLNELPHKLQKFYYYSKQVCGAIREKSIRYKIENDQGRFVLRQGKQELQFESQLKVQKIQMVHILNTKKVSIIEGGNNIELDMDDINNNKTNPNYKEGLKIMLKYLNQCLKDKSQQ